MSYIFGYVWDLLQQTLTLLSYLSSRCTTNRPGCAFLHTHTLWLFDFFVSSVVVSGVKSYCSLHVDTGTCLHNIALTPAENGAVFCPAIVKKKLVDINSSHITIASMCNTTEDFRLCYCACHLKCYPVTPLSWLTSLLQHQNGHLICVSHCTCVSRQVQA